MTIVTVNNDFIKRDLNVASNNEHYYNYSALTDINNCRISMTEEMCNV